MLIYHGDNIVFLINMQNILIVIDIEGDDRNIIRILMGVLGKRLFVINGMLIIKVSVMVVMLKSYLSLSVTLLFL